jgi:hypothetical protein
MANQRPWAFTQNPFTTVTNGSYRTAVRIAIYHLGAISKNAGDAFFDPLIALFTPLENALQEAYNKWKAQGGSQQGQTLQVTQLLQLLSSTKIKKWDIAIQAVYDNTTPQYKALLPNGRGPFQVGSQDDRITAVAALVAAIGDDNSIKTVKNDAAAFLTDIQTALLAQKGGIAGTKTNSDAVEAARVAMCTGMYANLGGMMQHFAANPHNIDQYFDLTAIRSGAQVLFTGETKPLENENIFKHTFHAGDGLLLRNEGVTELKFFLAAQKKDGPSASAISLGAGKQITITATDLGDLSNTFFNVQNVDTVNVGEWTVEFV